MSILYDLVPPPTPVSECNTTVTSPHHRSVTSDRDTMCLVTRHRNINMTLKL